MLTTLSKRAVTGFCAFAIVLSQVIMPAQAAYAAGNWQAVWCHLTANNNNKPAQWDAQFATDTQGEEHYPLAVLPDGYRGTDLVLQVNPATNKTQVFAHDASALNQNKLSAYCKSIFENPTVPTLLSGIRTDNCNVNWYAQSFMDTDIADYQNTGYLYKVAKNHTATDPGVFEVQHWMSGSTLFWRIPVATDYAIDNAKITVNLPAEFNYTVSPNGYDYVNDPRVMPGVYPNLVTVTPGMITPTATGVEINLGNLATGIRSPGVLISGTVPASMNSHDTFYLDATLTGTYIQGKGCKAPEPPDDTRVVIPLPTYVATEVCGPDNDTVVVDPAWVEKWGKYVDGPWTDPNYTKDHQIRGSANIKAQYRNTYVWASWNKKPGDWTSWRLYPGTEGGLIHTDVSTSCPAIEVEPVAPVINADCTITIAVTEGITYKKVFLDKDGNIVEDINDGSVVREAVIATADEGYVLVVDGEQVDVAVMVIDYTGLECGRGGAPGNDGDNDTTPLATQPTTPTNSLVAATVPLELPETGANPFVGIVIALVAAATTYGAAYFAQPRR